jgi:uncharacterized lipoprotein YmbA
MKPLRHSLSCWLVATLVASFALGCLGSSPKVILYTMNAVSDSQTTPVSDGLSIGVGPIRVPRYLDRPEWVTRPGGSTARLEVDDQRRWAGGFSANVLSALGENLGAKLGTQRVVVYPVQSPFPLDYRIAVDFHAFESVDGEALELRANWVIRAGSGEDGPWSGQSTIRRAIAGGGSDAIVAAHNEALDLLAGTIAARIESLPVSGSGGDGSDGQPSD